MTVFASSRLYSSSYLYVPFGLLPSQEPCQESLDLPLVGHQGSAIWSGSNWDYRVPCGVQTWSLECTVCATAERQEELEHTECMSGICPGYPEHLPGSLGI
ncbi:TPA: hypothetical protein ACH3X3_004130 [Trebouxia sp. C0006]